MKRLQITSADLIAFRQVFERIHPLSNAAWQAFTSEIFVINLNAGEAFIKEGEHATVAGYVKQGLLQCRHSTDEGKEFIHTFLVEGQFAAAYSATILCEAVKATFEAIEACELWCFDPRNFRALFASYPEWCHIGRVLVEGAYIEKISRVEELLTTNAGARFDAFQRKFAPILPRLQQQYVASYLGITPESLSRLRRSRKSHETAVVKKT